MNSNVLGQELAMLLVTYNYIKSGDKFKIFRDLYFILKLFSVELIHSVNMYIALQISHSNLNFYISQFK